MNQNINQLVAHITKQRNVLQRKYYSKSVAKQMPHLQKDRQHSALEPSYMNYKLVTMDYDCGQHSPQMRKLPALHGRKPSIRRDLIKDETLRDLKFRIEERAEPIARKQVNGFIKLRRKFNLFVI